MDSKSLDRDPVVGAEELRDLLLCVGAIGGAQARHDFLPIGSAHHSACGRIEEGDVVEELLVGGLPERFRVIVEAHRLGQVPTVGFAFPDEIGDRFGRLHVIGGPNVRLGDRAGDGQTLEDVFNETKIDPWFLHQIKQLVEAQQPETGGKSLLELKQDGFSDRQIGRFRGEEESTIRQMRKKDKVLPSYKGWILAPLSLQQRLLTVIRPTTKKMRLYLSMLSQTVTEVK